jgi:hypothetical protein
MKTNKEKTKSSLASKKTVGIVLGIIVLISLISLTLAAPISQTLFAGKNIPVGSVLVSDDGTNVFVHYDTSSTDWVITEIHLQFASDLSGIPQTKTGNPKPGQFEFNIDYPTPMQTADFSQAISDLNLGTGKTVLVAAQAEVYNPNTGETETAWIDGTQFPGHNWAMYYPYVLGSGPVSGGGGGH